MSDLTPTPKFEEEIRAAVAVPPARDEFVQSLHGRILQQAGGRIRPARPIYLRPAWLTVFLIAVLAAGILAIGPQRVFAAVRGLFGYIPGTGIVDQSASIRVLAEPVTVTRDGISITVTSAILTGDKTHIEYRIFGVPGSAYPDREDVMGCTMQEYLRLPNGTQLARIDNDFEPVPAEINATSFIMPCIFNTLPGKAPENWELPLRFIPAPPDLTVLPVSEVTPAALPTALPVMDTPTPPAAVVENTKTTHQVIENAVTVSQVIETADGYILVGQFQPQGKPGTWAQTMPMPLLTDAGGKTVAYTIPNDIQTEGVGGWAVQFKAAGLSYPLTISFPGVTILPVNADATTNFTFDAGPDPQMGQEWKPNQEIQFAGHTLKLASIMVDSRNGYSFIFEVGPDVYDIRVRIEGYASTGQGNGRANGQIFANLSYDQLPTGQLTITLYDLVLAGDAINWQGQWTPGTIRTDLPTAQPGLCLTTDSLAQLAQIPASLTNGKALFFEKLAETGTWGLALYNLDGSGRQVVTANGNWGALSPDGNTVAYSAQDSGIHLVDVHSQTDQALSNASGFNIHWSPDGTQIAYIGIGNGAVNSAFIAKVDGSQVRQISDWSYETIIGWSPDSTQLYFAVPFTGGAAWKVYAHEVSSGTPQERFTIENGTPKFLNPKLSPDGKWIAYRGQDNSSLYLVRTDGSDMHLLLNNMGVAGVEWSRSGWLGVSLRQVNSDQSVMALIKPDGCEAYRLPNALVGELQGLYIP